MDPSRNRGKKILQLALGKDFGYNYNQNTEPSFSSTSNLEQFNIPLTTITASNLNIMSNLHGNNNNTDSLHAEHSDDGDFSPASDDDKTYFPPKNKRNRSISTSSSSSSISSRSSSSLTSTSSNSSTTSIESHQSIHNIKTCASKISERDDIEIKHQTLGKASNNNTFIERVEDTIPLVGDDTVTLSNLQLANLSAEGNNIDKQGEENNKLKKKRRKKPRYAIIAKNLRNSGKEYVSTSKTKQLFPAKVLKQTCGSRCRQKCSDKILEDTRQKLFDAYWAMASSERQREFVARQIENINPKYQYKKIDSNRKEKNAFYFEINGTRIRVCKIFFKNTLNITDRCIRTVINKKDTGTGVLEGDKRGRHDNHRKLSNDLIEGVKTHINSIPRIESHYLRQQTTKEFIDAGKSLVDLHSDYKKDCIRRGLPYVKIHSYRKIFNFEFNIGFFIPKKDQCEQCTIYKLADNPIKEASKEKYDRHLAEKEKSREEKASDKEQVSDNFIVACYDLQAAMTVPKGEVSTFYYKSKINCLNFTILELKTDNVECYFWDESQGNRGANEIGSCVLNFLQKKSSSADKDLDIVFYSDNCCGQQKNQFVIGMYIHAVTNLKIKSITHKFLIRGHTQNEGDAVHSMIEKEIKKCLKSGPIYVPSQYVCAIRNAKKRGKPYVVNEMGYNDFLNLKQLPVPRLNKSTEGEVVKLSDIKVIKVEKNAQNEIQIMFKTSYFDDFKELDLAKRTSRNSRSQELQPLYQQKLDISERKKNDVRSLVDTGLIPGYYRPYYESIFN